MEHRRAKRFYKRVHKGKHVIGIGQQVRRERFLHRVQEQLDTLDSDVSNTAAELAETPQISATDHYRISVDTRQKIELRQWLKENESDPALEVSQSNFPLDSKLNQRLI